MTYSSSPNVTGEWKRSAKGHHHSDGYPRYGSIIKYCDKVVLLHKGEFIAEGPAGKVVDMYKKILAGKLDDLRAELAAEKAAEEGKTAELPDGKSSAETGDRNTDGTEMSDFSGGMNLSHTGLMRDQLAINTDRTEYGDGRAEIYDLGLFRCQRKCDQPAVKGGNVHHKRVHPFPCGHPGSYFYLYHQR